jgi:hypothetical protein
LFDDDSEDAAQSAEKRLEVLANAVDLESEDEDEYDGHSPDRMVAVPVDDELNEICPPEDLDEIRAAIAPVRAVIVKVRLYKDKRPALIINVAPATGVWHH